MRVRPIAAVALFASLSLADSPEVTNWTAAPFWAPAVQDRTDPGEPGQRTALDRRSLQAGPVALPFIALPPCRLVDTRGNGAPLTGGFLPSATVRSYTLTGVCNVPATAQAISLNATVVNPTGQGFLVLYPQGGTFPPVSTLNYLGGDVIVNAAVVPLSGTGGISVALGVSGGDVLLDTNGYYATVPSVSSLNGLTGNLALVAGSNVTLTPVGNTLTVAAPSASANSANTLVSRDGSGNFAAGTVTGNLMGNVAGAASDNVLKTGDTMTGPLNLTASLDLPNPVSVTSAGGKFLSTAGTNNMFFGIGAGAANATGTYNLSLGTSAYATSTNACCNTALGFGAMRFGDATGNTFNTAVGYSAYNAGPAGAYNTVIGALALRVAKSGSYNAAIGALALDGLTAGDSNTALGAFAGGALTTGSGNLYVSNGGAATESNTTRIGETQTRAFVAGVRGATTGVPGAIAVLIDANGQLGTVSSSARYKHAISDMADASARIMQLRPVTFRYNAHGPDEPIQFGLVAEEVNDVLPELVARNKDGEIETVMYHQLPALLLNELQKLKKRIDELEKKLAETEARASAR